MEYNENTIKELLKHYSQFDGLVVPLRDSNNTENLSVYEKNMLGEAVGVSMGTINHKLFRTIAKIGIGFKINKSEKMLRKLDFEVGGSEQKLADDIVDIESIRKKKSLEKEIEDLKKQISANKMLLVLLEAAANFGSELNKDNTKHK